MNSSPIDGRAAAPSARRETSPLRFFPPRQPRRAIAFGLLTAGGALVAALACGPFFPNRFLDAGDDVLLAAPAASFRGELQRLKLLPPLNLATEEDAPVEPPPPPDPTREDTLEAELADLRAALVKDSQLTREQREEFITRHRAQRQALADEPDHRWRNTDEDAPAPKAITVEPQLPAEFAAYFDGAICWKRGDTNGAIAAWERVLALPAGERRYKSVWAAYMLGKARVASDAARAAGHFREAQALAKDGCTDRLGLATSSLGWEAKAFFEQGKNYEAALRYLDEAAANGAVDFTSLQWVADAAISQGNELDRFARHPKLVRVVTASLLEGSHEAPHGRTGSGAIAAWLDAVEAAKVRDLDAAEQLALAAYTHGEFDRARRWLKLAPATPVAQWVQAKLLLRDGKVNEAAALLARLVPLFPNDVTDYGARPTSLQDVLSLPFGPRPAGTQLRGELATLRLARREFAASLDTFLQAGLWSDAAWVAERVLTLAELKAYVDARQPDPEKALDKEDKINAEWRAISVRWLLARRLVREGRGDEAGPYYPPVAAPDGDVRNLHSHLIPDLRVAWDESQPREARVKAFVDAGRIVRAHGLELLGTELGPDYFIHGGQFEDGISLASRDFSGADAAPATSNTADDAPPAPQPRPLRLNTPSPEERRRAAIEPADPPQRFHYRYIAADLLWRAAQLLPDQSDEKARVLCEGGTMIKHTHPEAADRYYKALVRQCGQTAIGKLADEVRWFPYLDDDGNLLPEQPRKRKGVAVVEPAQPTPEN